MFRANLALAPYGYRLGPDPASSGVATVGGVVANNASGMCCGTAQNSYKTIESMTFILPSGSWINTADPDAEEQFAHAESELAKALIDIQSEILSDPDLVSRIRKKFSIKNTTGYHMEAFLDGKTPLEIFRRLMVGSEGTLAFISEVVFETIRDDKHRLTGFLFFPDMHSACAAVEPFVKHGAAAVELLDRASIRAVEGKPGVPDRWKQFPDEATALLIEFRESTTEKQAIAERAANEILSTLHLLETAEFTKDPQIAAQLWNVRHGLLPSVGGARPSGTSLILEDVCFPTERLADGAVDVQKLLVRHRYAGSVFGHASAGNLHFLITPSLNTDADIARFDSFLQEVVKLVVDKYDGSLKAEHGTGRNIAPFVEYEWGSKLTGLMWKLKRLADPENILSPGVLLSHDARAHLHHLHTVPTVENEVDRCIECGYCEPVCPSRNLTTTPRQRIVLRREMLRQPEGSPVTEALLREYEYDAIETCAGDGSCALACPLSIDTGILMKHFRHLEHTHAQEYVAEKLAEHWSEVERIGRLALTANEISSRVLGPLPTKGLTSLARTVVSKDLVPVCLPNIPPAASVEFPPTKKDGAAGVYFCACVNRIFGNASGTASQQSLPGAMVSVSARAGLPVWIPDDIAGNCCATVWHSKGYDDGNRYMANKIVESVWRWSDQGRLPVVCDASSCSFGITSEVLHYLTLENREKHKRLTLLDSVAWAYDYPTGFECGVINSNVKPGDSLAIVGAGPVGLAALLTAQFYSPARIISVDLDDNRLAVARKLGATDIVNASSGDAVQRILALTGGRGVDCAIEAVGLPSTFAIVEGIIAAGGTLAVLGVHGSKVDLHLERLWHHNITLRTRLVDTVTTPMLLKTVAAWKIEPGRLITHHFNFEQILEAYETFRSAAQNQTLKVIIDASSVT